MPQRVSIALCTWNGKKYLETQLRSILAQTRLPDEIIIGDDASTDDCIDMALSVCSSAPIDINIIRQKINVGSTANFQATLAACTGDIIFPCDQDDVWHPSKLEICCKYLDETGSSWLFHDASLIDSSGIPLGKSHWHELGLQLDKSNSIGIIELLKRPHATGCCMAIRRKALEITFPFGASWIHDEWIASSLAAHGLKGRALPMQLIDYRIHPSQQVGTRASGFLGRIRRILNANAQAYANEAMKNSELEKALIHSNAQSSAIMLVSEKRQHYEFRSLANGSIPTNIKSLYREVASGRYRRYSWGRAAPIKDLIRIFFL